MWFGDGPDYSHRVKIDLITLFVSLACGLGCNFHMKGKDKNLYHAILLLSIMFF
ncbi:hypothetical protein HanRHA438_Chr11g0513721 [Helianthus annuus]|nr:hypothetical protein HanRHA438_Chr11g0513721 [Helianthus annuus]